GQADSGETSAAMDSDDGNETDLLDEEAPSDAELDAGEAAEDGEGERERARPKIEVVIDDSNMPEPPEAVVVVGEIKDVPPTPAEIAASEQARAACQAKVAARKDSERAR